jgi:hypothetical protein
MQIKAIPIPPRTRIERETVATDLAAASAPASHEMAKLLRDCRSSKIAEELLTRGDLQPLDFGSTRINHRLSQAAELFCAHYETALQEAEQTFRDFSRRFLIQAKGLTWDRTIALSPDEVESRFLSLKTELVDPIKAGSEDALFDALTLTIRIPVPVMDGTFSYADFVHEALHGISGRHAAQVEFHKRNKETFEEKCVLRSGLRFDIPNSDEDHVFFHWLNEGLVEYLTELFVPENKRTEVAYEDEVNIIRALTEPNGRYKIPLQTLTAAFFANHDPAVEHGLRFPEWHDLTRIFPVRQMHKISHLIERDGAEATVELINSENLFALSEEDLGL